MTHPHSLALVRAAGAAANRAPRQELWRSDERLRDRYVRRLVHLGRRPTGVVSGAGSAMMAEALSEVLGPAISSTSVRREMSRLRRQPGACLATRPYRLAGDLDADLFELTRHPRDGRVDNALAPAGDGLLPRSRAPGVVRLRDGLVGDLREAVELAMRDRRCDPPCNV